MSEERYKGENIKHSNFLLKSVIVSILVFSIFVIIHFYKKFTKPAEPVFSYYEVIIDEETIEWSLYQPYRRFRFDNINIARAAVSLSVADTSDGKGRIWFTRWGLSDLYKYVGVPDYCPETFIAVAPQLVDILNSMDESKHNTTRWSDTSYCLYASCDFNVALAVWWSGADDNYPSCLGGLGEFNPKFTYAQTGYLIHNFSNGKWEQVQPGSKILPGDIAFGRNAKGRISHTWMYVATWENGRWIDNSLVQEKFPDSKANRYEGSYQKYYPKLGYDFNPWLSSAYIFRFTGKINNYSEFKTVSPEYNE
ncbi:MAG: hypothetical protein ACOX1F_04035 [Erysipelotrichaceae bacterium]|jgi:hypothetical protein